ncbi:MAG: glycosyltransferase family 4 protein [Hyphomicrobiales bacterium]
MRIRFIIPGDINTPSGGYRYDRTILEEWRELNVAFDLVSLSGSYPNPSDDDKALAFSIIDECDDADITIVDGLAGGCFPELIEELSKSAPCISLLHHPLSLENGISQEEAEFLEETERKGLNFTKAVITTSSATSKTVAELFAIDNAVIHTVEPGVTRATPIEFRTEPPLSILSVGSITERKGHDVLIKALALIKEEQWHLTIIGPQNFDRACFLELTALCQELGVSDRVTFLDSLSEDELSQQYAKADIFALASRYEGYGMAYAEAIVRGIPVIGTTAGAIPDTVPLEAGILTLADDVEAFSKALSSLLNDTPLRHKKHLGALAVEPDFPTWSGSAKKILEILERLL